MSSDDSSDMQPRDPDADGTAAGCGGDFMGEPGRDDQATPCNRRRCPATGGSWAANSSAVVRQLVICLTSHDRLRADCGHVGLGICERSLPAAPVRFPLAMNAVDYRSAARIRLGAQRPSRHSGRNAVMAWREFQQRPSPCDAVSAKGSSRGRRIGIFAVDLPPGDV